MRHLSPQNSILDEVWQVEPWKTAGDMRAYLGRFLFSGDEVLQTVGTLSGGEKAGWPSPSSCSQRPISWCWMSPPTTSIFRPARCSNRPWPSWHAAHRLARPVFLDCIISRLLYLRDGTCTSYAGNYTDYQAHLTAQTAAQQPGARCEKTSQVPPRLRPRPAKRRKPSVIEAEIHHIEAEVAAVQTAIEAHDAQIGSA